MLSEVAMVPADPPAPRDGSANGSVVDALLEVLDLLHRGIAGNAVALLDLAGEVVAAAFGGGQVIGQKISMDMPGGEIVDTVEKTYTGTFQASAQSGKSSFGAGIDGFTEATKAMLSGTAKGDPGLVGTFTNFLLNPNRDPSKH